MYCCLKTELQRKFSKMVKVILPQNALRRDRNSKCIDLIEGHYLEVVVLLYIHNVYNHENVLCNAYRIPLYNGFYLFPLSRAINSNRLIFDPSEVEILSAFLT